MKSINCLVAAAVLVLAAGCRSAEERQANEFRETGVDVAPSSAPPRPSGAAALEQWDDNGNGRITCAEARAHGIAPVNRDHPAYPYMRDGDGDGVVCE